MVVQAALQEPVQCTAGTSRGNVEIAVEPGEEAAMLQMAAALPIGFSRVAQSAGVRISATMIDSDMAETMVMENWR